MKNFIIIILLLNVIGCVDLDIIAGRVDSNDYLRNKSGNIVLNCQDIPLFKKDPNTNIFWKNNNLPKGTTEFTCIDGRAYLKGKEPK
ncbi:hypothetical protein [Acinetobacter gerneri]|uniref:hypothetical protein n=1 Tax=Acinetobacter gerneri TaxID=202952 RepID=UPI0028AEA949|nr:hypothetical protein [Acinetobacter gerneri]